MIKLDLSENEFGGKKNKAAVHALSDALASSSLRELNLASSGINSKDAPILANSCNSATQLSVVRYLPHPW